MYTSYGGNKFTMANRSLYYHSPNLFPIPLNLQDMGPLHTTWRYSDLIAVVYMLIKLTHGNSSMCSGGPFTDIFWGPFTENSTTLLKTNHSHICSKLNDMLTDENDW